MFEDILNSVKIKKPLIHCITNPISITRCADAILAVGAKPIMAEHPREVKEITSASDCLVLNLGNITDVRMKSMLKSLKTANKKNIPVAVDGVGIACSDLRKKYLQKLLKNNITLIKGNYSEIMSLYDNSYKSSGVDSSFDNTNDIGKAVPYLAKKYNTIVLASGREDIVSNGEKTFSVKNGTPQLSKITGTGCVLGALCGCFLAVSPNIYGVLTACGVLGICGEYAQTDIGNGDFYVNLINALSKKICKEEFKIEEI